MIKDLEENPENLFKDDVMYQWKRSHTEKNLGTPGKIEFKIPQQNGEDHTNKHGAKYTEAEVQQLLMGLKREHKDNLELMQKDHDEALFKLRGEQATSLEYYVEKIQSLEEQLQNQQENRKKSFNSSSPAANAAANFPAKNESDSSEKQVS